MLYSNNLTAENVLENEIVLSIANARLQLCIKLNKEKRVWNKKSRHQNHEAKNEKC